MPICEICVKVINVAAPKRIFITVKSEFTPRAFWLNMPASVAIAEISLFRVYERPLLMRSAIILGHGRSGTNWLLRIFDKSLTTFCANERNELSRSIMSQLPDPSIDYGQFKGLEDDWREILQDTKSRFGERDPVGASKSYLDAGAMGIIAKLVRGKKRLRHTLAFLNPSFTEEEWPAPSRIAKRQEFQRAVVVLKINQAPALANWIMAEHPLTIVIHIVRHPCGMLNSWKNRYYVSRDSDLVRAASRNRLSTILNMAHWLHPATKEGINQCLSSPNPSATEMELWYWRYSNEAIMECATGKDSYNRVIYEDLVEDSVRVSQNLFDAVGLDFTDRIASDLEKGSNRSQNISNRWQEKLPENEMRIAENILSGSTLEDLWK